MGDLDLVRWTPPLLPPAIGPSKKERKVSKLPSYCQYFTVSPDFEKDHE